MIATATEMKAIVQDVYGSADVLQLREIDKPEPKEGEVLLRVRAAGVEPGVWHLMMGRPYLVRAMGFGIRAPKGHGRGREVAGIVEAGRANGTPFQVADEGFGISDGPLPEYLCAPERKNRVNPNAP